MLLGGAGALVALIVALSLLETVTSRDADEPAARAPVGDAFTPGPAAASPRSPGMWERHRSAADARFAVDLSKPDVVQLRFVRKPRAGVLFDVRTGRVLWRRNPDRRLPIASLTKMMTALLVVEREDPHDRVRITRAGGPDRRLDDRRSAQGEEGPARGADERPAARVGQRRRGRARAPHVGRRAAFVRLMNRRARGSASRARASRLRTV